MFSCVIIITMLISHFVPTVPTTIPLEFLSCEFSKCSKRRLGKSLPSCHVGQESECCPGLDHCQGSGWPRSGAQAPALGHSLPPPPPSQWGNRSPGSVGHLSERWDGGGGSAWSRKKYEFTEKSRLACRISGILKERWQTQQPGEAEWIGEKYRTFSKVLIFSKVWERGH